MSKKPNAKTPRSLNGVDLDVHKSFNKAFVDFTENDRKVFSALLSAFDHIAGFEIEWDFDDIEAFHTVMLEYVLRNTSTLASVQEPHEMAKQMASMCYTGQIENHSIHFRCSRGVTFIFSFGHGVIDNDKCPTPCVDFEVRFDSSTFGTDSRVLFRTEHDTKVLFIGEVIEDMNKVFAADVQASFEVLDAPFKLFY